MEGAPAGCEVKLVGVRWMYVHVHVQNATEYTAANCIVSMPHSVHMVCTYVCGSKVLLLGVIDFTSKVTHFVFFLLFFTWSTAQYFIRH